MTTSAGTIPAGLSLYAFEYDEGRGNVFRCINGEWETAPDELFLADDADAHRFAARYGALRAVHILSGRVIER